MRKRWVGCACTVASLGWTAAAQADTATFTYNGTDGTDGSPQTWVVPPGVTEATFDLYGAAGGASGGAAFDHAPGGAGARLTATLPVTPGETLTIRVGGAAPGGGREAGGYNGGGGTGIIGNVFDLAGGGGGATDVRRGADTLADRVLVAGGGGGGGSYGRGGGPSGSGGVPGGAGGASGGAGGAGVDLTGLVTAGAGGQPGGSAAGGAGGAGGEGSIDDGIDGAAGSFGVGAPRTDGGFNGAGGSGGGGWYGGGAGGTGGGDGGQSAGAAGGGGGSSHADAAATGVTVAEGVSTGHGSVVITFTPAAPAPPDPVPAGQVPVIGSVDRADSAPSGGDVVTITGSGFGDGTAVRFGDVVAATTVLRYDRLQAVVPPHAPGMVALTVRNAAGTSAPHPFTYLQPRRDVVPAPPREPGAGGATACVVPDLAGRRLPRARKALARAGCRLGDVRRTTRPRGPRRARVVAQSEAAGTRLTADASVDVTTRRRR